MLDTEESVLWVKEFLMSWKSFLKGMAVGIFLALLGANFFLENFVEIPEHVWHQGQNLCREKGGLYRIKRNYKDSTVWCFDHLVEKKKTEKNKK